jgi:hypothetical protein
MRNFLVYTILFGACLSLAGAEPVFKVIPLGVEGGNDESNLSAYALAVSGTDAYVCLDAGTLYDGIKRAVAAQLAGRTSATGGQSLSSTNTATRSYPDRKRCRWRGHRCSFEHSR